MVLNLEGVLHDDGIVLHNNWEIFHSLQVELHDIDSCLSLILNWEAHCSYCFLFLFSFLFWGEVVFRFMIFLVASWGSI